MHILICAATNREIQPTLEYLKQKTGEKKENTIRILIPGVGSIATCYHLMKSIQNKRPDYVIQAGIAGAFLKDPEPGKVVLVFEEIIGDLGAEENGGWMDIFDLHLAEEGLFPFIERKLINPNFNDWKKHGLPMVRSVSVNEVTTNSQRIDLLIKKYTPVIESMEGAAFHYICLYEKLPFMQIRAISNNIGERNKSNWKMEEAISNLNTELIRIIQSLSQ